MAVLQLIERVYILSNRKQVNEELHENSIVWRDILFDVVPMNRLEDAFRRAVKNNQSSFAPNAFDLLNSWKEIASEEYTQREKEREASKLIDPIGFCDEVRRHVSDKGSVVIYSFFTDTDEIVPCRACRPDDYEKWRKTQASLYGEVQPLTKLEKYAATNYANLKDPIEILTRAKNQVAGEMVKVIGTDDYAGLQAVWKSLINALGYVRENEN